MKMMIFLTTSWMDTINMFTEDLEDKGGAGWRSLMAISVLPRRLTTLRRNLNTM